MNQKAAVLLLAHGTPDALDEIPEYLSNVTGGRSLPDSVLQEIRHRYSLIGTSPLTRLTLEQGRLLSQKLDLPVYVGMRNWKPYIADAVRAMRADGVAKFAAICLAPQNSRTSVGLYRRAVSTEAGDMQMDFTEGWADHPLLADAFAERLRAVWTRGVPVLFTAHSVPIRTLESTPDMKADPYADEARRTAAMVAERVGLAPEEWFFAFQSQGMSGGPWIGPTVENTLTALRQQDVNCVIVQPVGFLCDHVEILYDVDIGFRQFAADLGMELLRPESLNDSRLLTEALADLARQGLARLSEA
ncbi:MAG TPA: ferrochelatase [Acidobacteriaceae bacterium]|jgi:ferrochelatase|nr:ferrochelatase [Acidobacteriaceae bacterium]